MATKIKKKETWKLPRKPQWSFDLLGIPPGHTIEFLYDGVFLHGPEETFTVHDQRRKVEYKYDNEKDGYDTFIDSLKALTDALWEKLKEIDPKASTEPPSRTLGLWMYCDPQTKTKRNLLDICNENKK